MWLRKNKPRTLIPIIYACAGVLATMPSITRCSLSLFQLMLLALQPSITSCKHGSDTATVLSNIVTQICMINLMFFVFAINTNSISFWFIRFGLVLMTLNTQTVSFWTFYFKKKL
ncbi:hypothetical protein B296_00054723 [Ensete ventricosum]|uniref:Uncharacterized protein n=1 Tax=Ensete ventricosum TaxID=4639 RepID=A0A426XFY2_ENSVE|nr:hypothetical protein B296_00054723 [Ensete ventricosum]